MSWGENESAKLPAEPFLSEERAWFKGDSQHSEQHEHGWTVSFHMQPASFWSKTAAQFLSSWQWVYTELWRSPCLSICCLFTQLKHSSKRHTIVKLNGFMERSKKARGLKYQPSNTDKSSAQPDRRNKTALTSVRRPEALLASVQHFCTSSSSSQGGGESE